MNVFNFIRNRCESCACHGASHGLNLFLHERRRKSLLSYDFKQMPVCNCMLAMSPHPTVPSTSTAITYSYQHNENRNQEIKKKQKDQPILQMLLQHNFFYFSGPPPEKPVLSPRCYTCSQIGPFPDPTTVVCLFVVLWLSFSQWSGCYVLVYLGEVNHQCTTRM